MREHVGQTELQEQTRRLLQGPLKHARAAALSMALVPLAVVAVTAVPTGEGCPSAGVCGVVYYDANNDGTQDAGEAGIPNAVVTLSTGAVTSTNDNGVYHFGFLLPDTYTVAVQIPPGMQPAPADANGDDTADSDGVSDGFGNSVATVTLDSAENSSTDFGFFETPTAQPGTGTPGYWKNHPEEWPATITVGGVTYTRDQALTFFGSVSKDKRVTMFASLVSAMLNVGIGNDSSCVSSTITKADEWMATYGAPGTGNAVNAASYAWKVGEPLHRLMDNYNNGMLCAPHGN